MATTKINITQIKDFEQEVKKIIEENFDELMQKYLSKFDLTTEDLKKLNKPKMKAIS